MSEDRTTTREKLAGVSRERFVAIFHEEGVDEEWALICWGRLIRGDEHIEDLDEVSVRAVAKDWANYDGSDEQLKAVDYTLGGRLPPVSPEESGAPRDEDDDLLERLCTERFDAVIGKRFEEAKALDAKIGEVRVRQSERTFEALKPLYAEWPRPWEKLRSIQHAEARRIVLTYKSETIPTTLIYEAAMRRADDLIKKHSP